MFSFDKISQLLTLSEKELPAYNFRENSFYPDQAQKMLVGLTHSEGIHERLGKKSADD